MVTLVGTQNDFLDALQELGEMEQDCIEFYQEAIDRLKNDDYKKKLMEFLKEHKDKSQEISKLLEDHNKKVPRDSSMIKSKIDKIKVILADMMDDKTILRAVNSNEEDTNKAYERMNDHSGKLDDAEEMLRQGLEEVRKHQDWLRSTIKG